MAVDERYLRIRRSLEETLGVEEASYLMDRPVGGWSELVTNHTLDLKLAVLDAKIDALRFELLAAIDRRIRIQTWSLITAMFAMVGLLGALIEL